MNETEVIDIVINNTISNESITELNRTQINETIIELNITESNITGINETLANITYPAISIIAFVLAANLSWVFAIDVEKEIAKMARKHRFSLKRAILSF